MRRIIVLTLPGDTDETEVELAVAPIPGDTLALGPGRPKLVVYGRTLVAATNDTTIVRLDVSPA